MFSCSVSGDFWEGERVGRGLDDPLLLTTEIDKMQVGFNLAQALFSTGINRYGVVNNAVLSILSCRGVK